MAKEYTYADHLREEVMNLESSDPDCMRKLLNLLGDALGELDSQGRRIEQLSRNANVASCLANGIQPD